MFTGIIQEVGGIRARHQQGELVTFEIDAPVLSEDIQIGDSLSVNGVCLTVIALRLSQITVNVIAETLSVTTMGELREGSEVNLEPAMRLSDRLSGHVVLGHVDGVGINQNVLHIHDQLEVALAIPKSLQPYVIHKGSIALDGVSLTVASFKRDTVRVAIIPYTAQETTLGAKMVGDNLNIEVDVMGKYLERLVERHEEALDIDASLADRIKLPAWPPRGWESSWN